MPITLESKYTKESLSQFSKFSAVRTRAQIILYVLLELCMLVFGLTFIFTSENQTELLLSVTVITPLFLLVVPLTLFLTLFFTARQSNPLIGSVNLYEFTDEEMRIRSIMPNFNGESQIKYQFLDKIYETDGAFYIFISNRQAFIIDKSDITLETILQLRELFQNQMPANNFIQKVKQP